MTRKVQGDEVLWAIQALEPVTTQELADVLPISYPAVLHRCHQFTNQGYLTSNQDTKPYTWRLSATGEDRLANAYIDLPASKPASVRKYFTETEDERSYRSMTQEVMLATVADIPGEWHTTSAIVDEVDVVRQTVRKYLHQLEDQGWVAVDKSGQGYRWRVTEDGRERLANLNGEVVVEDTSYATLTPVELVEVLAGLPGEWRTTTAVVEAVAVSRDTVLGRLHEVESRGWVAVDKSGQGYRWRVTEAGREQLMESNSGGVGEEASTGP